MHMVILNQIFGCNRLGECARATWIDYDQEEEGLLIRNMKHPKETKGNDVSVKVREEQRAVIAAMPRTGDRLFTEACHVLGIEHRRGVSFRSSSRIDSACARCGSEFLIASRTAFQRSRDGRIRRMSAVLALAESSKPKP